MAASLYSTRSTYMRHFTRFYTQKAGVLNEALLDTRYGLTEGRLIYEIAARKVCSAKQLCLDLELDPGYMSRCLKKLEKQGLLKKTPSPNDRRQMDISLTDFGLSEFAELDRKSSALFARLLENVPDEAQLQLLHAMSDIENILGREPAAASQITIRPHHAGDMGWIVQAHGRLYFEEYGWNTDFEALVAEIAAGFLKNFKPGREICWIAEKAGQNVGSAVVVEEDKKTAKLRLVIVDPVARGHHIGLRLVEECLSFARHAGYTRMTLWTNDNLHAAIGIYKKLGFELISEEPYHGFGHDLVGQYWARDL